jgi:hypothetical protein
MQIDEPNFLSSERLKSSKEKNPFIKSGDRIIPSIPHLEIQNSNHLDKTGNIKVVEH